MCCVSGLSQAPALLLLDLPGRADRGPFLVLYLVLVVATAQLAQELASRNITVNCVAHGFMRSAMTDVLPEAQKAALLNRIPAGDLGKGEDIGAAVVYLASKEAGYVTGQTLHVNGGMAML